MKKLYTLALSGLLGALGLNAQISLTVNGEPSDKTFATIVDAFNDALALDTYTEEVTLVYTIEENVTATARGTFEFTPAKRYITFKGANPNITLSRSMDNFIAVNKKSNYVITFEDLIIEGGNKNKCLFECESGCVINFSNVKFQNAKNTANANGIVNYKNASGSLSYNNVTYGENIEISENAGMINTNGRPITLDGKSDVSFRLVGGNAKITAGADLASTGNTIDLYLVDVPNGSTVVAGSSNVALFKAIPSGTTPTDLNLVADGGNIKFAKPSAKIGENSYLSLQDAVAAAVDGDVVELFADQTISSRFGIAKDITIKSANEQEPCVLNYGVTSGSKIMLLFNDNTKETNITLENLIIEGNNNNAGTQFIEVSNKAHVTLNNIVVRNCENSNGPVIKVMGNGYVNVNGLTMENCAWASDNAFIFFGNSKSTLTGKINTSLCLENNYSIVCEGLEIDDTIDLVFTSTGRTNNSDVLRTFTDIEKINFSKPYWSLSVARNNIVANFTPADTEGFYTVVKQSTATYDAATAEATNETLDNITIEEGVYKFIVFKLAEGMSIYVAEAAAEEEPATILPMAEATDPITVNDTNYILMEGNVLPVTEQTSFIVKSGNAQSTPVEVTVNGGDPSGIDEIASDNDTEAPVYYNLQGIRVDNPAKGQLLIKKTGNKAVKVLVK